MRRVTLVAVGLAVVLSATACTESNPIAVAAPASQSPVAQTVGTIELRAQNVPGLGEVVVDGNGYVLYRYDRDSNNPPTMNCDISCGMTWPPVTDTGDIRLEGVDRTLVGTVVRFDATKQVTINGWPVYRYGGDHAPGVANGEGVGGVWYAVTPTGRKAGGGGAAGGAGTGAAGANGNADANAGGAANAGTGNAANGNAGNGNANGGNGNAAGGDPNAGF